MKRRGKQLVQLATKNGGVNKEKQMKKSPIKTSERRDARQIVESPVRKGCEQEIQYLMHEIGLELDCDVEDNTEQVVGDIVLGSVSLADQTLCEKQATKQQQTTIKKLSVHILPELNINKSKLSPYMDEEQQEKPKEVEGDKDLQGSIITYPDDSFSLNNIEQSRSRSISELPANNDTPPCDLVVGQDIIHEITNETVCQSEIMQNVDTNKCENLSVAMADIVFDSPTSSFTIPTPLSSVVSSPVGSPSTRRCTTKRGPGKIRARNYSEWQDLKRKALKNSGKAFTNKKGETIAEKEMKPPCNCPKKCFEKLEENDRQHIFNCFWETGSHEKQWEFILKYVTSNKPKRIKAEGPNRSQTRIYTLPKKKDCVVVCRKMFLNTLSISEKTVRGSFKKRDDATNKHNLIDLRGRHGNRPKKIKENIVNSVKHHILSLAPVDSHYCRKGSNKKYLDGQLSYKRLHVLYTEWFDQQTYGSVQATLRQYQDIVNSNFNIAFYCPKKDQCDKCHAFNSTKEPTEAQKSNQEQHMQRKNLARSIKAADKAEAESNAIVVTAIFDMQKILTCPFGNVSIFYYKRKLNLYNFTVYDVGQKSGYCYMWTEVMGKKGANEISSGLSLFIRSKVDEGAKIFRFWSDNCSGQNKNRIVFAFYQYILQKFDIESITHRFLEVGHTQNEGDSVHSVIEGVSNKKTIYTPDQWINLIRWAKITKAYRVKEMTLSDIYNYRPLLYGKNWTHNDNGEKVVWNKVKEVQVTKENTNVIKYKYELDEDYNTITTLKKITRGKKVTIIPEVKPANDTHIKIGHDKYKDLVSMCETKIIPEEFHHFFFALPHEQLGNANIEESSDDDD